MGELTLIPFAGGLYQVNTVGVEARADSAIALEFASRGKVRTKKRMKGAFKRPSIYRN
jgi:hypothetical protein